MTVRLLTPGPTPVPDAVRQRMAQPIIHHRTPEFAALWREVHDGLREVFRTESTVLTFAASGTGAMEAAVANLLSPGERAITIEGGKFGERWTEILRAYGTDPVVVEAPWGRPVDPAAVERALSEHRDARTIFATASETSTGIVHPIRELGGVAHNAGALLVVDAVTALGGIPYEHDAWGVDVTVAGSQKALMLPPGLAFVAVSEQAWHKVEAARLPRYYWDFRAVRQALAVDDTPFTPAISLVMGLAEALGIIGQKGLETIWVEQARRAAATRAAVTALGLPLFPEPPGDVVTVFRPPEGFDANALLERMEARGVKIAGGQGKLSGKILRISHLGAVDDADTLAAVTALEGALADLGYGFKSGTGVAAAQRVLPRRK